MAEQHADRRLAPIVIVAAAIALLALTWFGARDAVRAHRLEAEARVGAEVASQALSLEGQLREQFLTIDQALRVLALEWRHDPDHFTLAASQHDAAGDAVASLPIFLAGADGLVRASTTPGLLHNDVGTQDYFRAAAASAPDDVRLVIGALRQGSLPGQWQMTLARRLSHPDGSFDGVMAATFDTATLAEAYRGLDALPEGVIAIVFTNSNRLYPLAGAPDGGAGAAIAGTQLVEAIEATPDGRWTKALMPDGIQRILAFRRGPGSDLGVLVGVDRARALRPASAWERDAWAFAGAIGGLLVGVAGLLLRLNVRASRREATLARERATLAAKTVQLGATLAGMSDGIMMIDADLRLLEWNDHFPEFTGVPSEILRAGLPMEDMLRAQAQAGEFGAVDVEAEVSRRMALLRAGGSTGRIQRTRPNGRMLELRRNPLPGGGFVTLYTDVTARHEAEERLQQAQKMAAVGRLTAGVAHDFNNLLASVVGSAELMQRQVTGDVTLTRRLSVILQSAGRGSKLVRQLLAFARNQPLKPVLVDLNQIVPGMAELLRATLGHSIRIETRLATGLWQALVDPLQVEHMILNLAINARDAMPAGGVLIIATSNVVLSEPLRGAELVSGEYVTVALTDNGTGMTEEVRQNAFEPFFTTKTSGHGSGLGLSQVYVVASQAGGGVRIDSTVGRGTTVTVFLPRGDAEASCGPSRSERPAATTKNEDPAAPSLLPIPQHLGAE